MKKIATALLLCCAPWLAAMAQQTELTSTQAKTYYKNTTKKRVSVHDPSVVWEPNSQRYYIFGSHRAAAWSSDLQNWTAFTAPWKAGTNNAAPNNMAFTTPQVTTTTKGGQTVSLPAFNAMEWAGRTDASYNINGNMWAPDVLWNPIMKKWCMYLSINGDQWHSSIILLTSNQIEGPYEYQAPVVISGFYDAQHSYKDTDLELVIGTQSALPSRYAAPWASTGKASYPNNIDPCVFYDEQGKLWMAYGSWSGGIWMLELNEENGLRDYDVTYSGSNTDPYFGKRIAGGYYASGEAPYIEHVGGYYYLFVTYGGLDSVGGYVMRVFRSQNPDGPYVDAAGTSAVYTSYKMNYGKNADTRGVKILGAYADWGFMTTGELSQGHNSIIAAADGRTYLVYHTRFNDGTEGHQVRVHQVFQTKNGWLVASPFEYNGEELTDEDIKTREPFTDAEVAGTYQLLVHKYDIDYAARECMQPVEVVLGADGKITGAYKGTWSRDEGTGYLKLVMSGVTYNGVLFEQTMDEKNLKTISFSALASNGLNLWGYRLRDDYALAWQLNNQTEPVRNSQSITKNLDLYAMHQGDANVTLTWNSSKPEVVSNTGKYAPLAEATDLTLTARLDAGQYFWQKEYAVKAAAATEPTADFRSGMVAHYDFDDEALTNSLNNEQQAELKRYNTTAKAKQEADELDMRNGLIVHTASGANYRESFVEMPNPFYQRDLSNGATLSFWVRRAADTDLYGDLYGFYNPTSKATLFMTGNCYTGYNDQAGTWLDINHPTSVQPTFLSGTRWHHVIVVFNRSNTGLQLYVDGTRKSNNDVFNGAIGDKTVTTRTGFNYAAMVDHLTQCPSFFLGYGGFWGSAEACFDDVIFYDRALSITEAAALNTMANRVYSFREMATGISSAQRSESTMHSEQIFDLSGRRVEGTPRKGLYIKNGKKIIIR